MIVDADALADYFKTPDIKVVRKELRNLFDQAGLQTGASGVSVHARAEVGGVGHQVDIMVVPKAEIAQKFHIHDIPKGSPYKGVHKQILISKLAKMNNLLWSPYEGLYTRGPDGKKNKFYTDDMDKIAKTLLGNAATSKDLGSVESMLAKLPADVVDQIKQEVADDPNWQKSLKKESFELDRIRKLAGL
jgi:hypothetical protein